MNNNQTLRRLQKKISLATFCALYMRHGLHFNSTVVLDTRARVKNNDVNRNYLRATTAAYNLLLLQHLYYDIITNILYTQMRNNDDVYHHRTCSV